jgi:PRC-barrel domain
VSYLIQKTIRMPPGFYGHTPSIPSPFSFGKYRRALSTLARASNEPMHHSNHRKKINEASFLIAALTLLASSATFAADTSTTSPSSPAGFMTTMPGTQSPLPTGTNKIFMTHPINKIGDVKDVLVNKSGQITAVIISVGGFLGIDTKDAAAPFQAIHAAMKDNKWWLVMDTTKDALKTAPGYKYNENSTMWVSDQS